MADRVESVSRRTGGFVCSISGSAAPVRRLWVQSSAQLQTASARAGSTLVCTFCSSSAAPRRRSARLSAAAALSRKRAAAIATTRTPCARAPPPQGASAKEPVTIRQRRDGPNGSGFALFIRGQQLRQVVSRAWHGAHGRLRERVCWSGRTHEKAVGAVKCISRHGKALRSAYGGAQLQLLVIDRRRRQGARRCGDALARTWRLLTPPAGRAHAHAHGGTSTTEPVPTWRCLLEPQRLDTSDPKHASRDEPSLTDRQESVPRRTCGFGSVFIGLAAPTRRL